jgi:serine/threonine-protein kinase RsbW
MSTCTQCFVELRLPNLPEFIAVARMTVAAVAIRMEFDVEAIYDIKVAVSEALTNAIEHGCGSTDGSHQITLRCDLERAALAITISDEGDGFDYSAVRGKTRDLLDERGLGLIVIEALMDTVEFSSEAGRGTCVRMVKRLPALEAN